MKIKTQFYFIIALVVTFGMLLPSDNVSAQISGSIAGRVTDASTGDYLPGANVFIEGTNFGSATDRAGIFRISKIPPGSYTLKVSYIGYEDFSTSVTVTAGATVRQDIKLTVNYVEMEEVVVEGLRQGQGLLL